MITVAQNQQTQMYEAKVGYVRTQFYMIPTGKVVENAADRPLHEIDRTGQTIGKPLDFATGRLLAVSPSTFVVGAPNSDGSYLIVSWAGGRVDVE